jgi:hypothetical protein
MAERLYTTVMIKFSIFSFFQFLNVPTSGYLLFSFFLFSFSGSETKIKTEELFGKHWAGSCIGSHCDTLELRAFKKYDGARYQWGGCAEGMEFFKDGTAQTFSNVMCSTESSPMDSFDTKWQLKGDTLIMDGYYITTRYLVISLSKKTLQLKVLDWQSKEIK